MFNLFLIYRYTDENNIVYENTETQEHIFNNSGNFFL